MATLAGFVVYAPVYYITGDRYLMTARPFYALFIGALFVQSVGKKQFVVSAATLSIFLLQGIMHFSTQYQAIQRHGPSAKNIVASVRRAIPYLPDYSIVFIDAETNELRDTYVDPFRVGALPASTSLAVYYQKRYEDIEIIDYIHCDVFAAALKRWEGKPVSVFYFFDTEQEFVPGKPNQAFERCNINEKR